MELVLPRLETHADEKNGGDGSFLEVWTHTNKTKEKEALETGGRRRKTQEDDHRDGCKDIRNVSFVATGYTANRAKSGQLTEEKKGNRGTARG